MLYHLKEMGRRAAKRYRRSCYRLGARFGESHRGILRLLEQSRVGAAAFSGSFNRDATGIGRHIILSFALRATLLHLG